jgi:hypothetical protein
MTGVKGTGRLGGAGEKRDYHLIAAPHSAEPREMVAEGLVAKRQVPSQ